MDFGSVIIAAELCLIVFAISDVKTAINDLAKTVRDNSAGRGLHPLSLPTRQ